MSTSCEVEMSNYKYDLFMESVKLDYHYRLYVDKLPSAVKIRNPITGQVHTDYYEGIPVGILRMVADQEKFIIYNHWVLTIRVQPVGSTDSYRIVGFEVEPRSFWPDEVATATDY